MQKVNMDRLHLVLLAKMDTKMLSNCFWIIQTHTLKNEIGFKSTFLSLHTLEIVKKERLDLISRQFSPSTTHSK